MSEVQIDERRTFTGIVRHLTVRKKLQVQRAQAQKMEPIGQLAAGIPGDEDQRCDFAVADKHRGGAP